MKFGYKAITVIDGNKQTVFGVIVHTLDMPIMDQIRRDVATVNGKFDHRIMVRGIEVGTGLQHNQFTCDI